MPIFENRTLRKLRAGELALGFGVNHLRTTATPLLAQAAGYDWLFIDGEHGAFSVQEMTQICFAALPTNVTPIVRVCKGAIDEGTRALDNGAMGIVMPHVDTAAEAKEAADAFRYPPDGHRSWGGATAPYGFVAPPVEEAQAELNREIMVIVMIESPTGVENAEAIAAVPGVDALLIGTSDLTAEMGISGQYWHERVQKAYEQVAAACNKHGKALGMGGVYDEEWTRNYIKLGVRMIHSGSDHGFLMDGATIRSRFLRSLAD